MISTHRRMKKGFSYIEVVMAMALIGLSMAGAYRVLTAALRARQNAHNHYTATVMANNRIERAKNVVFENLELLGEQDLLVNESGAPDPEGRFWRTTEIDRPWDGQADLARVKVTVEAPRLPGHTTETGPTVSVSTLLIGDNP